MGRGGALPLRDDHPHRLRRALRRGARDRGGGSADGLSDVARNERQAIESNRRSLEAALEARTLVRAEGRYDWHETIGYVVAVARDWALIQIVDPCGHGDGFRALGLEAIAEIAAASPEDSFLPAGEWYEGPQLGYDSITRIGFGGRYEEALGLAAGPDPEA